MTIKTELVPVAARDLQVIEYRGQRVVTTEQLAGGYGTDAENIRRNFNRNKSRFVEGKHFFQLMGNELENLRVSFSPAQISNKTRSLTLWTERGAANHAKMLETDQAWGYHEELVEFYFTQRDALTSPADAMKLLSDPVTLRGLLMNYSEDNVRLTGENQALSATVDNLEKHFTKGMTLPAFGKALNGVNTSKITWWAYQRGWIYNEQSDPEKEPRWRVKSYARDKYLTEQDVQIKDVGKEPFTKKKIVLLQKGTHRIYQLYLKGELPMKTTWNGEFSHDKAVYTPEAK